MLRGGAPCRLGNKQQQLLAVLMLFAGRRVSSDVLVDFLWSDSLPANPSNSLQDVVKRLRSALGDPHHQLVVTQGREYSLLVDPDQLDLAIFERLAKAGIVLAASGADSERGYVLLERALEVAEGDLPDTKPGTGIGNRIDDIYSLRAAAATALSRSQVRPVASRGPDLSYGAGAAGVGVELADVEDLVLADIVGEVLRLHGRVHSFSGALLLLAFPGLGAAVSCASAITDRLWATGGLLRGAIGRLNQSDDGSWTGPLLELVSSASPGQILVPKNASEAVATSGVKELLRPYNGDLWQISRRTTRWESADRSFSDDVPIVGRDETMREITLLLKQQRMITLRGPGGIGKTRIARELAGRLTENYRDGVCFADLAEADDHGGALSLVARTLSFVPQPYRHLEDTLVDLMRESERLLILDNCERFSEEMRSLCEAICDLCPSVIIMTTSRSALGASHELVRDIGELDLVDAAQLMVSLAFSDADSGSPEPLDPMIVRLCSQLDNVPLAIECAASMVRAMGLAAAYAALESLPDGAVLPMLDTAHRGRGRHRSIELALSASYSSLREPDALLLESLSTIRGGFTTHDAAGMRESAQVRLIAESLGRLCEASLVKQTGDHRWRLLETVRQFGATRLLRRGDHAAQAARHAMHFISLATEAEKMLTGTEGKAWFERLTDAYPNLDKALSWAVESGDAVRALQLTSSLWWYWAAKGMFVEGARAVERALALEGPYPDELRAKALVATSHLSWWAGNPRRTESSLTEAMETISRLEGPDAEMIGPKAWAHTGLAAARFWGGGNYDELHSHLEEGRRLFASIGDLPGLGLNLSTHSGVAWHYGRDTLHLRKALESLRIFGQAEHQTMIAHMTRVVGLATAKLGDARRGRTLVEEGLQLSQDLGDIGGLPLGLAFLGLLETWDGSAQRATAAFEKSITANQRLGQLWPSLLAMAFGAERAALSGRPAEAIRLYSAAECISDRTRIRLAPDDYARVRRAVDGSVDLDVHDVLKLRAEGAEMSLPSAMLLALDAFH